MAEKPKKRSGYDDYGWFYRGFITDLFGRLLPGILFIASSAIALLWPLYILIARDVDVSCSEIIVNNADKIAGLLNASWVLALFITLFLGYAFGHLFYRSEIKIPDQRSLERMMKPKPWRKRPPEDPTDDLACDKTWTCEYPYPYLANYLRKREFKHLLPLVPWDSEKNMNRRSKKYIDILKIRIALNDGEFVNAIYRNEAHVRLSSSIWYAASALCWVAAIGLAIIVFAALRAGGYEMLFENQYYAPALAPGAVLGVAIYCRRMVVDSLHEMRMREIIFVLETAYQVFKHRPEELKDIAPGFSGKGDLENISKESI